MVKATLGRGLLAPLVLTNLLLAIARMVITGIIFEELIVLTTNLSGIRANRTTLAFEGANIFSALVCLTAALIALWHIKTYRSGTRYTAGSMSWLATIFTMYAAAWAIRHAVIRRIGVLNWVSTILTWAQAGLMLLQALLFQGPLSRDPEPQMGLGALPVEKIYRPAYDTNTPAGGPQAGLPSRYSTEA